MNNKRKKIAIKLLAKIEEKGSEAVFEEYGDACKNNSQYEYIKELMNCKLSSYELKYMNDILDGVVKAVEEFDKKGINPESI